ncbi:MAG: hypothetical protein FJX57_09145 [Alphaproteobacteria bacterium]|nr:hypothetical protein [Alphaproteobacteria bacterium]
MRRSIMMRVQVTRCGRRLVMLGAGALATLGLEATASTWVATPRLTKGPFYPVDWSGNADSDLVQVQGEAARATGEVPHLRGRVLDTAGTPISAAQLEIWQCDAHGVYRHPRDESATRRREPGFQGRKHGSVVVRVAGEVDHERAREETDRGRDGVSGTEGLGRPWRLRENRLHDVPVVGRLLRRRRACRRDAATSEGTKKLASGAVHHRLASRRSDLRAASAASSARARAIGDAHCPTASCRNSRTLRYHGESSRLSSHRQSGTAHSRTHVGTPSAPPRCAVEVQAVINRSHDFSTAAESAKSSTIGRASVTLR